MNFITAPIMYALGGLALAGALATGVQSYRLAKAETRVVAAQADTAAEAAQVVILLDTLREIDENTLQMQREAAEQAERAKAAVKRAEAAAAAYRRELAEAEAELAEAMRDPKCAEALGRPVCARLH